MAPAPPGYAAQLAALREELIQTQQQVRQATEQVAEARQRLEAATQQLTDVSIQLSTLENNATRPPVNLLTLPRELRDEIYKYLLIHHRSVKLHHGNGFTYDIVKQPYCALSLTCRLLHNEATEIFFAKNSFM